MNHDVFISYSSQNKEFADEVCENLENNGIGCWIAPRNIKPGTNYADEIMKGLNAAKIVLLVFSKEAHDSKYVTGEIHTAFSTNKRIVSLKVDEMLPEGDMKFYLKNTQWIDASPEALEDENKTLQSCYDQMVVTVKNILAHWDLDGQCIKCNRMFKKSEEFKNKEAYQEYNSSGLCQKCQDEGGVQYGPPSIWKRYRLLIIGAVLVLIVAVAGFMILNGNDESSDVNETALSIGYVGIDDYGDNNYVYSVFGTVSENLTNSKDVVHIDYYDASGKVIDSSDTKVSDIEGNTLGSIEVDNKDTSKVSVELKDADGKVIYSEESENILEQ